MGARSPRGGGGVRGRRRGGDDRSAGGLRGQLRAGQPASDQRPVRRQPQPRAGARDRRAHPARGDRRRATSRRRIRRSCSGSAASTRSSSASPSSCRGCWKSRCASRSGAAASPWWWSRARSSCTTCAHDSRAGSRSCRASRSCAPPRTRCSRRREVAQHGRARDDPRRRRLPGSARRGRWRWRMR